MRNIYKKEGGDKKQFIKKERWYVRVRNKGVLREGKRG